MHNFKTVFIPDQEKTLADCALCLSKRGFPLTAPENARIEKPHDPILNTEAKLPVKQEIWNESQSSSSLASKPSSSVPCRPAKPPNKSAAGKAKAKRLPATKYPNYSVMKT